MIDNPVLSPPPPVLFICYDGHTTAKLDGYGKCSFCGKIAAEYQVVSSKPSLLTTPVARYAEAKVIPRLLALLDKKQRDYGPSNIARHGQVGVVVRLDDKLARISNLLNKQSSPANEPILDSWDDIANYGIIGSMVARGEWPKE